MIFSGGRDLMAGTGDMTNKELQEMVERISTRFFHREFLHQARFNPRLRTTGGRYLLFTHDIELNPKQLDWHGTEEFVRIIKHELCHYHLHLQGKGYKHSDPEFKALLNDVGGSKHCKLIPGTKNKESVKHCYECRKCGQRYYRKRRINTGRYACGICKGKLRKKRIAKGI
jgi:SprT-like protein